MVPIIPKQREHLGSRYICSPEMNHLCQRLGLPKSIFETLSDLSELDFPLSLKGRGDIPRDSSAATFSNYQPLEVTDITI